MTASIRAFADNTADPKVSGFLHLPDTPNGNALVLTHGAGSNAQAPLLRALADAFCAAGFTVLRCDLPYRQARSFGPPGPGDAARDRAGLKTAIEALKKNLVAPSLSRRSLVGQGGGVDSLTNEVAPPVSRSLRQGGGVDSLTNEVAPPVSRSLRQGGDSHKDEVAPSNAVLVGWGGKIFLAGHSYGGRQSSILCAELSEKDPNLVAALLLLSYPLHPPLRPEQQRTQHLPDLRTPALFVHGTRDPFGSIAEIEQALKMIPARTKLLAIEGAGHDLGFKGKAKDEALAGLVLREFQTFAGGK
ncbi:hypothetical protein SBA1_890008 [Candidatus Sulfotelmatobacter kueseliae]|uniref:KANL3/Tex30 alpha/beta hydrolase-like domain-containing protein n=1 Tax=Candidatus Sulfotelmatobacter kueseliae TaxID=2042962 RepID=A0A2U3LA59_9BACT|nr:hypothetical protein SBA1_890008 [Candidatus Sulfotelmatobacter kueseliae]